MNNKKTFLNNLLRIISEENEVISVTHVGSFLKKDLSEISDIDIVVIVNSLTPEVYEKLNQSVSDFNISKYFPGYKILLNSTFGPLKIIKENTLIIHLMIYSLTDHQKHTKESPFTTLDWEISSNYKKNSLSSLSKTYNLSLQDFTTTYRGSSGYLNDIVERKISGKQYEIVDNKIVLESFEEKIDKKYEIEFSFHIFKNIIGNFLKFITKNNTQNNFEKYWKEYLPLLYKKYYSEYLKLNTLKLNKDYESGFELKITEEFISDFNVELNNFQSNSKNIFFVRHMETELNKESIFYGTHNDSKIIEQNIILDPDISNKNYGVYSSEALRTKLSAEEYGFKRINIVKELNEIEYGVAENMTYSEFEKKYPLNSKFWNAGIDKRFPKGENHYDVLKRINKHINKLQSDAILFTHQVPIRVFLGNYYEIPKKDWYKIYIPHNKAIKFLKYKNEIFSNIDRTLLSTLFKNL